MQVNPASFPLVRVTSPEITSGSVTAFFSLPEIEQPIELKELLHNRGFTIIERRGSHTIFFHSDGRYITVPTNDHINEVTRELVTQQAAIAPRFKYDYTLHLIKYMITCVSGKKFDIIIYEAEERGYTGQCQEISGAISQAETDDELIDKMKEAIQLLFDAEEKTLQ